jgi:hypothetical protein
MIGAEAEAEAEAEEKEVVVGGSREGVPTEAAAAAVAVAVAVDVAGDPELDDAAGTGDPSFFLPPLLLLSLSLMPSLAPGSFVTNRSDPCTMMFKNASLSVLVLGADAAWCLV